MEDSQHLRMNKHMNQKEFININKMLFLTNRKTTTHEKVKVAHNFGKDFVNIYPTFCPITTRQRYCKKIYTVWKI